MDSGDKDLSAPVRKPKESDSTHPDEGKTGRYGLSDLPTVLGVVPRVICRAAEKLERLPVFRGETVPSLAKTSDGRRVEGSEDGEKSVVVIKHQQAL